MKVKIKKLNENAVIPKYGSDLAAGMDLVATSETLSLDYIEYGTGLGFQIPEGYVGLIFPRSSISNTSLTLANSVGVIDADYRGEVKFRFKTLAIGATKRYKVGERIGQIIIVPYPKIELEEVTELDETKRGAGGYGSTGK